MSNANIAWRRKKYKCRHTLQNDDGITECGIGLCQLPVLMECCVECPDYEGRDRGLGDTIARATKMAGIKTCGGCQKRREALNKMTGKLYDKIGKEK